MNPKPGSIIPIFIGVYLFGILTIHAFNKVIAAPKNEVVASESQGLSKEIIDKFFLQLDGQHCDIQPDAYYRSSLFSGTTDYLNKGNSNEYRCRSLPLKLLSNEMQTENDQQLTSEESRSDTILYLEENQHKINTILKQELLIDPLREMNPPESLQIHALRLMRHLKTHDSLEPSLTFYYLTRNCRMSMRSFEGVRAEICSMHRHETMQTILALNIQTPEVIDAIFQYALDTRAQPLTHFFSYTNYDELNTKQAIAALLNLVTSDVEMDIRSKAALEIGEFGVNANFVVLNMLELIEDNSIPEAIRKNLILTLGQLNTTEAGEALKSLMKSHDLKVRQTAHLAFQTPDSWYSK